MTRPHIDREALTAALAEEARSGPGGGEPEPEEILDYLAGRLSPEEERRIDRQLAASPAAARALLDLADIEAAGAAAGSQPAELAVRAGWRDLRSRLPDRTSWTHRLPSILSSVAAALLIATLGLGTWVWRLQGELNRPVANVRSVELAAETRAGAELAVDLAPGAPLRLVLAPEERCPSYAAEIEGPGLRDHRVEGLKRDDLGRLTLLLRGRPGSYRLRLSGCAPSRQLEEHRFRITANGG
jgi:hypothetical protein